MSDRRILDFIGRGQLDNVFWARQHWITRESLERWIVGRHLELARYMSTSEVKCALGLTHHAVRKLAEAGLIRFVKGYDDLFSGGYHFLGDDVTKIIHGFEQHNVPRRKYPNAGKLISLPDAVTYFGRDVLPALIQAVGEGDLIPVAYGKRFRGILGYLFQSEKLEKYQRGNKVLPRKLRNQDEAAPSLGLDQSERLWRLLHRHELNRIMGPHRRSMAKSSQTEGPTMNRHPAP